MAHDSVGGKSYNMVKRWRGVKVACLAGRWVATERLSSEGAELQTPAGITRRIFSLRSFHQFDQAIFHVPLWGERAPSLLD